MNTSRVHIRVDKEDLTHIHYTLFMNGANCGGLIFRKEEGKEFIDILAHGCTKNNVIFQESNLNPIHY